MKKLGTLGLVLALALGSIPARGSGLMAMSAMGSSSMPMCKGRMVVVNVKTKTYVVVNGNTQKTTKMMTKTMMCEATAKAKGYHLMVRKTIVTKKTTIMKAKTPVVNPSGALNADKGASPNPDNNANGVHTTVAPKPTPTP